MIISLKAIIWLRWRLLANSIRGGKRRDRMEQISRALALFVPLIVAALFAGSVVAVTILGFVGGRSVATGFIEPPVVVLVIRTVLAAILILLVIVTAASPAQTTIGRYSRLLLLPIPRRVLHLIEVLANLADPWIVTVVMGLLAFAVGLLVGGRAGAALVALVAGLAVLSVLAALGACLSFLVGWLFRSRRRGELFTLVFVGLLSLLSLIPMFFSEHLEDRVRKGRQDSATRPRLTIEEFDQSLPMWTRVLPSELYGRTVVQSLAGRADVAGLGLVTLFAEAGLFFVVSSAVHRKMLDSLEGDQRRRKSADLSATMLRLPLVPPAVSAVAWAQLRTALRSVRGRLAVLLPGPMLALITVLFRRIPDEGWAVTASTHGHALFGASIVFCFYSLQAFTMNLFGSDRSGLTLQFLAPIRDRDLAWGKVLGCGLIFGAAIGLSLAAVVAVTPTGSPLYWVAVLLGGIATFLLLSPIAVWMSALFPVAADLSKSGSGGNPHPLPTFAGTFLVLALAAPAILIVLAAQFWWEQPTLAPLAMLAWLAIAAAVSIPLVNLAARAIGARRENLALTAQGK